MAIAAAALSTHEDSEQAVREVLDRVRVGLGGHRADLAVVFASAHHAEALGPISARLRAEGLAEHVIGCTGESIVGEGREIESGPALTAWAIRMPGIRIRPFRATASDGIDAIEVRPGGSDMPSRAMILLGDPFSFPAEDWLAAMNERHPAFPVVGGMASAASVPGDNRLILDGDGFTDGAVGVLIDGAVRLRTVVSQGCRPIGRPMIVTGADRNIVLELGREPAVDVLKRLLESLDPEDMQRARQGLHLGRVMSEYRESFGRGDFLVRNVIGVDPRGGIAITDLVRVGQTVQFHVRDAESADEDLRALLEPLAPARPVGGLMFTCNGRGTRLFRTPDHDAAVLTEAIGPVPLAGFFAMGELGPVADRNYLHGYTASIIMFEPGED